MGRALVNLAVMREGGRYRKWDTKKVAVCGEVAHGGTSKLYSTLEA